MKMTINKLLGLAALALLLNSCDNSKEIKQFAEDFATAANDGDTATINRLYPDASCVDSLSVIYSADSVVVVSTDDENQFVVKFNSTQSMTVEKGQDGNYRVSKAYGLLALQPGIKDFLQAAGCYDASLTDKENAERVRDTAFVAHLYTLAEEHIRENVMVEQLDHYGDDYGKYIIALHNESDVDLPNGSYTVTAKVYFQGDGAPILRAKRHFPGEEVAKGEIAYYPVPDRVDDFIYVQGAFSLNRSGLALLSKIYHPAGSEYQDYIKR